MTNEQKALSATYFSIIGNVILAIIKTLAGIFGNSFALIADAIESITDILASFLVLLGIKYASKPPDENHPYGHGRAEPLITVLVVGFLFASGLIIAIESIENIQTTHDLPKIWTLYLLAPLILWKEISFQMVMKKAKETKSSALKADAWHHRSDAFTSIAAFIGIAIAIYFGPGYETADDWAALVAAGFILYNAYKIFRPALAEIMDEHLYDDMVSEIREIAAEVEGITHTEKCFVRKTGMKYYVDLHASVDANISVKEGHDLSHKLQDALKAKIPELGNVLIHIEPDR
ncbi:MAG: cation transporter [Saprospiraceae bacterium]|nr:cation transporter [Saprospiraceae bacterium]